MAESLCHSPETITTLLISYTPIQNKKLFIFFKKKYWFSKWKKYPGATCLCSAPIQLPMRTPPLHTDLRTTVCSKMWRHTRWSVHWRERSWNWVWNGNTGKEQAPYAAISGISSVLAGLLQGRMIAQKCHFLPSLALHAVCNQSCLLPEDSVTLFSWPVKKVWPGGRPWNPC